MIRPGRYGPLAAIAFFVAYLAVGLSLYPDYGVPFDEPMGRVNGLVAMKYMASLAGKEDSLAAVFPETAPMPDLYDFVDRDYGVIFDLPVTLIDLVVAKSSANPSRTHYLVRHLCTFLVFYASVICFFLMVKNRFGSVWWGITGSLFLVLSPRIFAESFYNGKDIVFLALYVIATYCITRFLNKLSAGNAFWLALASAAAINSRILGIILPCVTGGFVVLDLLRAEHKAAQLRRTVPPLLLYLVLFALLTVLFWPYLWESPVGHFVEVFRNMSRFRWTGNVQYLGQTVSATQLPWHYIPVWVSVSTPVLYLLLFVAGVAAIATRTVRNKWRLYASPREREDLLHLALAILPVLAIIILQSVLYSGWRHLYFIYGSFLFIAVRGLFTLHQALGRTGGAGRPVFRYLLYGAVAWSAATTGFFMVRHHPFQFVYFNFLAGSNIAQNFERDYWGLAYRQGLEYIFARDNRSLIAIKGNNAIPAVNNKYLLPKLDQWRFRIDEEHPDYFITEFRGPMGNAAPPYPDSLEKYAIEVAGVKIMSVYQLNPPRPYSGQHERVSKLLAGSAPSDSITTHVENMTEEAGHYIISGWTVIRQANDSIGQLHLGFAAASDTLLVPAEPFPRPDVRSSFQSRLGSRFGCTGFQAIVPKSKFRGGAKYKVLLAVTGSGQQVSYADLSATAAISIQEGCTEPVQVRLPTTESDVQFVLDGAKPVGACVQLNGWCHVTGQDATGQEVVLVLGEGNAGFPASRIKRPDVHEAYRQGGSALNLVDAGYTVLIPQDVFHKSQRMGLVVTLPGGKSYFKWLPKPGLKK